MWWAEISKKFKCIIRILKSKKMRQNFMKTQDPTTVMKLERTMVWSMSGCPSKINENCCALAMPILTKRHKASWAILIFKTIYNTTKASQVVPAVKNLPVQGTQETKFQSLGWDDPLENEMATHFSIPAWKILLTEEPHGLLSMGSQRIGRDWAPTHTHTYHS